MPRFIHIDIAADDPEREASFFRNVPSGNIFSILESASEARGSTPEVAAPEELQLVSSTPTNR